MSKIITIPSSLDEINKTKNIVDGFIIGIKGMCVNTNYVIDDLDILNVFDDKEIFINLNKNMSNMDLERLELILKKLNNYKIKGVLFYDTGVINLSKRLDLNYDLIISQEHSLTNSSTINFWNRNGVDWAYLSTDITIDEIIKIKKSTNSKIMINLFGYIPMFASKRHIVKNYLDYFKLNDRSIKNYMEKEEKIYPIIDNNEGTIVYSNNILNGIKYSLINVDYITLNSFNIDLDDFIKVVDLFKFVNNDNVNEYNKIINNMFTNVDYGFLERKTIYKVGHEK